MGSNGFSWQGRDTDRRAGVRGGMGVEARERLASELHWPESPPILTAFEF